MKIFVTQGHEEGIGLEVFLKTCIFLPKKHLALITLVAFKKSVEKTLKSLKTPYILNEDYIELAGNDIPVKWMDKVKVSQSHTCLLYAMNQCEKNEGILYTLPTSKDQFPGQAGHTEFFRDFYQEQNLGMFFSSPTLKVLLITDHIAVNKLSHTLTENLIYSRLMLSLSTLCKWQWPIGQILISGLNPHAGEHGLIGAEDSRVKQAIRRIRNKNNFKISGPYPGDTMLLEKKSENDILVYLFHDQGLGVFKGLQGFIGSNITLGLPYPRFSPDHGTSFSLYGKNEADYRGCAYSLNEALSLLKRITHGKNPGH